jgi:RNA polymerase sigma-70 factor (ECF subfamily)
MTSHEFNNNLIKLKDHMERFALSLTLDKEEAKDLIQETYLKALIYKDKFVDYSNLKAWVFTIMKNIFINNYRKSVRVNTIVDNSKDLLLLNNAKESKNVMPDSEYSYHEINKMIDNLENEFRIPFTMHNEGYKYQEIADNLNLKIGTVKSRIFFTRKKLTEALVDYQS